MIFNISLLEYHLFRNIEETIHKDSPSVSVNAFPSVAPDSSRVMPSSVSDPAKYVKYIHSSFRVEVSTHVFYFYFRDAFSTARCNYTMPSSLEIVSFEDGDYETIIKAHFFDTGKPNPILVGCCSDDFTDVALMKASVVCVSSYFVKEFVSYLKQKGII